MKNTKMPSPQQKILRLVPNARRRLPIRRTFELLNVTRAGEAELLDLLQNQHFFIPNIEAYDDLGRTLLLRALETNSMTFARFLLEAGANPNQVVYPNPPYEYVTTHGNVVMLNAVTATAVYYTFKYDVFTGFERLKLLIKYAGSYLDFSSIPNPLLRMSRTDSTNNASAADLAFVFDYLHERALLGGLLYQKITKGAVTLKLIEWWYNNLTTRNLYNFLLDNADKYSLKTYTTSDKITDENGVEQTIERSELVDTTYVNEIRGISGKQISKPVSRRRSAINRKSTRKRKKKGA